MSLRRCSDMLGCGRRGGVGEGLGGGTKRLISRNGAGVAAHFVARGEKWRARSMFSFLFFSFLSLFFYLKTVQTAWQLR